MTMGPNMRRLASVKVAKDTIPDGGSLVDGLKFLSDPKRLLEGMKAGLKFAEDSVKALREAAEPNPYRSMTDEQIAGAILAKVQEQKKRV